MNRERLIKRYPSRFKASRLKSMISLILGGILFVGGIVGITAELILAMFGSGVTGAKIISLILNFIIVFVGYRLYKQAPSYSDPEHKSLFLLECQNIYDEILRNNYANANEQEEQFFKSYDLDGLISSYHGIDRIAWPSRFGALCHIIIKELK